MMLAISIKVIGLLTLARREFLHSNQRLPAFVLELNGINDDLILRSKGGMTAVVAHSSPKTYLRLS